MLCLCLAATNVGLTYFGFWILANDAMISAKLEIPAGSFKDGAIFYIVSGIVFAIGNLALPLVPKRPWAWVLHLCNIIAAVLFCILIPIAVPVLIAWFKPEAKAMFDFR